MKRWVVMMLVLGLVFVGCSRPADQSTPEGAEKSAVQKEALESTKAEHPAEHPKEAAQAGEEDPDVANCLQLVSQAKFTDALPVCLAALKKDPSNERVKEAVKSAQAGVGDAVVGDAAATATDAAKGAQQAGDEKAQGAVGAATGGLAP